MSEKIVQSSNGEAATLTAVDYIQNQEELEKEARELMPYDPNECTYEMGELRQPLFACLTCSAENENQPIGVCYSCSIQCHLQHELVELFTKRSFVCDCGTTRMKNTKDGACKLRRHGKKESSGRKLSNSSATHSTYLELAAEDIPSSSNTYNQNYHGRFCGCKQVYNPLEETGHMIQCYFGFTCGEDWYHDRCVMGITFADEKANQKHGNSQEESVPDGTNIKTDISKAQLESADIDLIEKLQYFPKLETFDEFICWRCVTLFKDVFEDLDKHFPGVILSKLPRFSNTSTVEDWYAKREKLLEPCFKKIKIEESSGKLGKFHNQEYSLFLSNDFRFKLIDNYETLDHESKLYKFLLNNSFLFKDDPIFKPPEDDSEEDCYSSSNAGTGRALETLPRDKAIESIQAYDKIKSKLKDFFKPFAEQGKVVTEEEVRNFFGHIDDKNNDSEQ